MRQRGAEAPRLVPLVRDEPTGDRFGLLPTAPPRYGRTHSSGPLNLMQRYAIRVRERGRACPGSPTVRHSTRTWSGPARCPSRPCVPVALEPNEPANQNDSREASGPTLCAFPAPVDVTVQRYEFDLRRAMLAPLRQVNPSDPPRAALGGGRRGRHVRHDDRHPRRRGRREADVAVDEIRVRRVRGRQFHLADQIARHDVAGRRRQRDFARRARGQRRQRPGERGRVAHQLADPAR